LLHEGADPKCKAFEAIGYREIINHLKGELTFEELSEQVQRRTRQYAKRQLTWFRKEPGIFWLHGFGDEPTILEQALLRIKESSRQ
jgi:tRNA dimethylallyltransferase